MGVRIAMRALVIGGTSGIGNSIYNHLKPLCNEAISTGRKEIDTTSLESIFIAVILSLFVFFKKYFKFKLFC